MTGDEQPDNEQPDNEQPDEEQPDEEQPDEERLGLRERKKLRTRRALADAASRLFLERGYDATTVADIAAAAEVSTRTFFSYFRSKEDVLFADTDERIEGLSTAFERGPGDEPRLDLLRRTVVEVMLTTMQMRQQGWRTRLQLVMTTPALRATAIERLFVAEQVVTRMIVDELGGGTDEGEVEATTIAGALLGAVRAVAMRWMAMGATGDLEADVNRAFDLLIHGLAGAKALEGERGPTPGGPSVRSR